MKCRNLHVFVLLHFLVIHLKPLSKTTSWFRLTPSSPTGGLLNCFDTFSPQRSSLEQFMNHCFKLNHFNTKYFRLVQVSKHSIPSNKRSLSSSLLKSSLSESLPFTKPSLSESLPFTKPSLTGSLSIRSLSSSRPPLIVSKEAQKRSLNPVSPVSFLRRFSTRIMAPITGDKPTPEVVDTLIKSNRIMIFSKTTCPFCTKVKGLFTSLGESFKVLELDQDDHGSEIQSLLAAKTGKKTVPQVFINGNLIGGCDDTMAAHESGELRDLLKSHPYEYDLIVIGGGSGGLAASKQAASYGKKVAVYDFVSPTPKGTAWGLGGTCVNVGCIPKKLMHQAALVGGFIKDSNSFGWTTADGEPLKLGENVRHDWDKMVQEIQMYIKSLNFGYRVNLREKNVTYVNALARFIDSHTIQTVDKKGTVSTVTSDKFIIATGERPRYPVDVTGYEHGITSDDLFSLNYNPGKSLLVGASYVSLECAGFLHGLGNDVTVMVRSILLRGFDQEIAEKIGDYMSKEEGIKFIRPAVPVSVQVIEEGKTDDEGRYTPGLLRVTAKILDTNEEIVQEYNTVIWAIGRDPCTANIGLDKAGVAINPKTGKIPVVDEGTNVPNIYAIGDILQDRLELTPVAIEAGKLLSKRIYGGEDRKCDYVNVPTTVFTPLEYGSVGYSEEKAIQIYGKDNIEVYHQGFLPLEWTLPHRDKDSCWSKLIVVKSEKEILPAPNGTAMEKETKERVIGFHYLGPNAGEVTQMAALPLKMKATKADFDALIGIHPTCAETFTTLSVTKSSGADAAQKGC